MDLFDKCGHDARAADARRKGVYPYFIPFDDRLGAEVVAGGRRVLMFGSNDYLGLSTDPRVRAAAVGATERYGTSCTGSRLLNGTLGLHTELERRLAAFVGKEDAAVFGTGFQTNVGVLAAVLRDGDAVYVDHEAHASILDGCRMSGRRCAGSTTTTRPTWTTSSRAATRAPVPSSSSRGCTA